MTETIILPAWLITDAHMPPKKGWGVRVVGDEIAEVAANDELRKRFPDAVVWEAPREVLAPGFVNSHTHMYGVLAHGIPLTQAPSGFWPFLEEFWWPLVENRLDHAMISAATDLKCAIMLKSGVTSFYDCTEAPNALPGVLSAQAEIVRQRGMRGILSFEATERLSPANGQLGLAENAAFIDDCHKQTGLVSGMMCFHTSFTCSAEFIQQTFAMALERGGLVHMHLSEGTYEPQYALKHFGLQPIHYYEQLGLAGSNMLASQCVQIDKSEIERMAALGVRMTHMPLSNCEVGGGIAPVPQLIQEGVTAGLGSDGYIDNFFAVMRGAFLIHKAYHLDPRIMPADVVWHMATEGGAKAIGLEKVGRLEPGWKADLQWIDSSLPTPLTEHNMLEQLLLYCNPCNVQATMVGGRVRVRNGEVLDVDLDELQGKTREEARRLWSAV